MIRDVLFAAALAVAGLLTVAGVATADVGAALVVAGLELGAWSWLVLADSGPPVPDDDPAGGPS